MKSPKRPTGKNALTVLLLTSLLVNVQSSLQAQPRWSAAFRGSANFPTKDLGNASLQTGMGIEGTVVYRFMPHFCAVAGWGWNHFASKDPSDELRLDFEETGYLLGLKFIHPITRNSRLDYMLGAGGTYAHIETENAAGDLIDDTGHGLGWQVEAGIIIPINSQLSILPDVRYRTLSRDITVGGRTTPADLSYLSAGISFSLSIGKKKSNGNGSTTN